jgi:hypothetical protein
MSDLKSTIKGLHTDGLKGIKQILYKKGTFKKAPFLVSLILSITISTLLLVISAHKSFHYLKESTDLILSFFPNLLGFSLGGYALVVGFSNTELIKAGTTTEKHSVYQILNAIFSLCIILQVIVTLSAFLVSWIIRVNLFELTTEPIGIFGDIINSILILILIFTSIYSLALTPYLIINLFTLSQLNNSFLTIQKIVEDRKNVAPGKEVKTDEKPK